MICGNGSALDGIREMSKNLSNILFMSLQPIEKLNELLNMADIHLLPQRSDIADLVMPSKLINMMASGRPIIATAGADTQVGSVVSECGIIVKPGDVDEFVEAIELLVEDRAKRVRLGLRAREIALERWEKEKLLSKIFANSSL